MCKNKINLMDVASSRNNNWNLYRVIAATLVIFSHSVPISQGDSYSDFLSQYTKNRLSLGGFSVGVFFFVAGFLITRSAQRDRAALKFFLARIKRIIPQLAFVSIISAFLIGPVITSLSIKNYFSSCQTYRYLLNSVLVIQHDLPGVFTHNAYGTVVNGALWTLPVEFMCYVACFFYVKWKFDSEKKYFITLPIVAVIAILLNTVFVKKTFFITILRPVLIFYVGMGCYILRKKINLSMRLGFVSLFCFVVLIGIHLDVVAMVFVFPFFLLPFAYATKHVVSLPSFLGEPSYGMYLWGFVVQQIVCCLFGGHMQWYVNALISVPIAFVLGIVNHYVIDGTIKKISKRNQKPKS
jgi:peptidoglycan/LPS O-acetylase OafA/YrhL